MGIPIVKEHTVPVLIVAALPADQGVCLFPLCRCHAVKGTVRLALYGRQSFIWVLSHVFPPFCFPLPLSPKRLPAPFLRRVPALARSPQLRDKLSRSDLWTKCPEVRLLAVLPRPEYSFSDGHSVFKVLSIDELPQVYTFSTACAVYP